jgi:hypothetical protein
MIIEICGILSSGTNMKVDTVETEGPGNYGSGRLVPGAPGGDGDGDGHVILTIENLSITPRQSSPTSYVPRPLLED